MLREEKMDKGFIIDNEGNQIYDPWFGGELDVRKGDSRDSKCKFKNFV